MLQEGAQEVREALLCRLSPPSALFRVVLHAVHTDQITCAIFDVFTNDTESASRVVIWLSSVCPNGAFTLLPATSLGGMSGGQEVELAGKGKGWSSRVCRKKSIVRLVYRGY